MASLGLGFKITSYTGIGRVLSPCLFYAVYEGLIARPGQALKAHGAHQEHPD